MTSYRIKSYIYLLLVVVIWGAAGPVIKYTLGGIDPLSFLAYRFSISAVISIIYFAVSGINFSKILPILPLVLLYGLFSTTIALGLLFVGLDRSTVLDLTLIGTISPLIIVAGGALFFHDHITKREKIGISIVLAGALLNSFAPIVLNGSDLRLTGNLFILAFLFFDSSSILISKKVVREKLPPSTLTNLAFIIGALTMVPIAVYSKGAPELISSVVSMPLNYHLGVWYMAVLSGTLAYYFFVRGQKSIEISEAILFNYLQPLVSIPLAIFWLGESVTLSFVVGGTLIAVGIVVAEYKKGLRFNNTKSKK